MTEAEFDVLKARCVQVLDEERGYCTAAYIAEKINEPTPIVSAALDELEDDDEITLQFAPCYCKHHSGKFDEEDNAPIKDSYHNIEKGFEFWAPF